MSGTSYYGPSNYGVSRNTGGAGYTANAITERPQYIADGLTQGKPSRNVTQASIRSLRLYRKACRMIPFILRVNELATRVTPIQARLNLMQVFKEKDHMRDPGVIDAHVYRGYEMLVEAEWKYAYTPILYSYLCPLNDHKSNFSKGYSYLENKKYEKKSKFLAGFYKGGTSY